MQLSSKTFVDPDIVAEKLSQFVAENPGKEITINDKSPRCAEWRKNERGNREPVPGTEIWSFKIDPKLITLRHDCNAAGPYSRMAYTQNGHNRIVSVTEITNGDAVEYSFSVDSKWIN